MITPASTLAAQFTVNVFMYINRMFSLSSVGLIGLLDLALSTSATSGRCCLTNLGAFPRSVDGLLCPQTGLQCLQCWFHMATFLN